jgi:hypothetical protein
MIAVHTALVRLLLPWGVKAYRAFVALLLSFWYIRSSQLSQTNRGEELAIRSSNWSPRSVVLVRSIEQVNHVRDLGFQTGSPYA